MTEKLKPCPLGCGTDAKERLTFEGTEPFAIEIGCTSCRLWLIKWRGRDGARFAEYARNAWNRRPARGERQ